MKKEGWVKEMNKDDAGLGCGCLAVFALAIGLFLFTTWGIENAYNEASAQIEQLRADAAYVDPQQAEDVIGQVTVWNQRIAGEQYNNTIPIIGFLTSDRWDEVARINVPQ